MRSFNGSAHYGGAVSELRIVPWQPNHRARLDKTLETPDELTGQFRDLHGPDGDDPYWRRTFVAETGGPPVGVATVFASRWHPTRLWLAVEVAPAHRRCGIGNGLLEAARAAARHAADRRPLRAKVFADSPGARFAEANGFHVLQRSRTFRVHREQAAPAAAGFRVDTAAPSDAVAEAFLQFYVRFHSWDPPGDIGAAEVRRSHVDPAATTLLVRDAAGSVAAVGCLYDEPDGLLLSGGATSDNPQARLATRVLLEGSGAQAEILGRDLLVEADDAAAELVAELHARGASVADEVHVVAEA
jgi:GNAT superfamily N-acetyltransferase